MYSIPTEPQYGLLSSMFLTLLVVPVIYEIIYPLDRLLRKFYENK